MKKNEVNDQLFYNNLYRRLFFMEKYLEWFKDHQKQIIIFGGSTLLVLLLLGIGVWYFYFNTDIKASNDTDVKVKREITEVVKKESDTLDDNTDKVVVDIKGAVMNPGVYEVDASSRVGDAITIAGGVNNNGDLSVINLSKKVFDEMVIIVYTRDEVNNFVTVKKEEKEKQEKCVIVEEKVVNNACVCPDNIDSNSNTDNSSNTVQNKQVSLNNASKEELMSLSGIGESKADLIIEYRNANGGFKSVEELKNIKGIGDSILEKIKDNITL